MKIQGEHKGRTFYWNGNDKEFYSNASKATVFDSKAEAEHELTWIMQHELQFHLLDNLRIV